MINSVRNTILSVLNKNNYGYISPSDFNLFAKQAQMEIFDEYFSNYNKVITMENNRMSGTDYANIGRMVAEVIEGFLVSPYLVPLDYDFQNITRNRYFNPSVSTTGTDAYMINKIICYPTILTDSSCDGVQVNNLIDSTASFVGLVEEGDIVVNWDTLQTAIVYGVISNTQLFLSANIFPTSGDAYYIISARDYIEPEKVNQAKMTMLNMSNLTAPTSIFPSYVQDSQYLTLYPYNTSFQVGYFGQVQCQYFRYPKDPKWTYITLGGGEPVFDQSQPDYQDFELPLEDEYKVTMKILQYCGVSIREMEVASFGIAQEQHEQPTFSQQQ